MNYIAHIHIGSHTQTHLLGNFLGDFVKGSQLQYLPFEIEQGIRLHRSIVSRLNHKIIFTEKTNIFDFNMPTSLSLAFNSSILSALIMA